MTEKHDIEEYYVSAPLKIAVNEAKKAIKNEEYDKLAHKLKSVSTDLSSYSFLPSITTEIIEFLKTAARLCTFTSKIIIKNKILEERVLLSSKEKENRDVRFASLEDHGLLEESNKLADSTKKLGLFAFFSGRR